MNEHLVSEQQKDGTTLKTQEIYDEIMKVITKSECQERIPKELIEEYAICTARWIQCEEYSNRLGLIAKSTISQKPLISPYVNAGIIYLNQSIKLRNEINTLIQRYGKVTFEVYDPSKGLT